MSAQPTLTPGLGLGQDKGSGWRPGRRRVPTKRARIIERLKTEGVSNREIARRLGVTEKAIRKQVGPSERQAQQQLLPLSNLKFPRLGVEFLC